MTTATTGSPASGRIHCGLAPWQLRRVLNYIDAQLGSTIRSSDLSGQAGLSKSYFSRAFKASLGVSPSVYIIEKRIEQAREMILAGNATLGRIAVDCGLCDQAHFCRVFLRLVGVSPGAWRRSHCPSPARDSRRTLQSTARPAAPIGPNIAIRNIDIPSAAQIGSNAAIAP
jgi:AraC family transcriptional regulator